MEPSPIAATKLAAMKEFTTKAARLMPGMAFRVLMAALATRLTVPTSTMEFANFLDSSLFMRPTLLAY